MRARKNFSVFLLSLFKKAFLVLNFVRITPCFVEEEAAYSYLDHSGLDTLVD